MANTAIDLLTFDEFSAWAGHEPEEPGVNQPQVELLITAASRAFMKAAGGRIFLSGEDKQEFDGHGGLIQQCRFPPVASDPALVIEYWNVTAWATASTGQFPREVNLTTGEVRMTNAAFGRGSRWRLTYTGGYAVVAIPEDIKGAVFDLVQRAKKRVEGKQGVKSDGRADQQSTFDLHRLMNEPIAAVAAAYRVFYNR